MPAPTITLISHALCPYVQRIAIALAEKRIDHTRRMVDLADKPSWFLALSPLGRTPVLMVGGAVLFESAAILEYLEETSPNPLHPADAVERAHHRAWMGFGAEILNDIAGFYSAPNASAFEARAASLKARFSTLEAQLGEGQWFAGENFSLVDAVYAPAFRYFDTFDRVADFGVFEGLEKVPRWRDLLARRPTVRAAVDREYPERLHEFLIRRGSHLSRLMAAADKVRAYRD